MINETEKTVDDFNKNIIANVFEPFVIYGTGMHAEAIVRQCHSSFLKGFMDVAKTGEFEGYPIFSYDDVIRRNIKIIVIVARPALLPIIYDRLESWAKKNAITILNINGEKILKDNNLYVDSPYFEKKYDELIEKINRYDVISFDIFDTLLMRYIYEPTDIFYIMEMADDEVPSGYGDIRIETEKKLRKTIEPNIHDIYEEITNSGFCDKEKAEVLKTKELEKELSLICVREKMLEAFNYAIECGKKVYLVSDMYWPTAFLQEIVYKNNIQGYEKILVSCDYNCTKEKGLFEILKTLVCENEKILHIGDNNIADGESPQIYGIDSYLILSSNKMLEISAYKSILKYTDSIMNRTVVGMIIARVFNDPFAFYRSQGKVEINTEYDFAYLLISPLVAGYLLWMINIIIDENKSFDNEVLILFFSRDGWLVKKIFDQIINLFGVKFTIDTEYIYISRKAIVDAYNDEFKRRNYLNYINKYELEKYKNIYVVDFMSRGTCQLYLEKIIDRKIKGLYFQRSIVGKEDFDLLNIKAYCNALSAYDNDYRIMALCDFLECIFTSYEGSVLEINEQGRHICCKDFRELKQLDILRKMHDGIENFCYMLLDIFKAGSLDSISFALTDELLKFTSKRYTDLQALEIEQIELDELDGVIRNTGKEILI